MAGVWSSRSTPSANAATSASSEAISSPSISGSSSPSAVRLSAGGRPGGGLLLGLLGARRLLGGSLRRGGPAALAAGALARSGLATAAALALPRGALSSVSSSASRTPASLSSRRMDRASPGVSPACSNAVRRSERDRWPWLRPRWIRSSTRDELASSSAEAAVAIRGMRHLPPSVHVRIGCAVQRQHDLTRSPMTMSNPAPFHRLVAGALLINAPRPEIVPVGVTFLPPLRAARSGLPLGSTGMASVSTTSLGQA